MTKSELIELIAAKQKHLPTKDVELAVKQVLEIMSDALAQGSRIARQSDGSYTVDDKSFIVTLASGSSPAVLRQRNGRDELLLPVQFDRGEARIAYNIVW